MSDINSIVLFLLGHLQMAESDTRSSCEHSQTVSVCPTLYGLSLKKGNEISNITY